MSAVAHAYAQDGRGRRPAPRSAARSRRPAPFAGTRAFRVFCLLVSLGLAFGLARVTITARAVEAAAASRELRAEIETERRLAGTLEAEGSSLATPSRIGRIAGSAMAMAEPADVRYVDLGSRRRPAPVEKNEASRASRLLSAVMSTAAGEAQVLLVGDVGLASSR